MALDPLQRHKMRKLLQDLDSHRGRHTELVSVYIPKDYDVIKIIQQLQDEQGTATNIKSASTRKNVTDALERMIQHLRLYKKTPENGLACFAGNVADVGQSDVKVWSVEPPVPFKLKLYRCDKNFVTEPLHEMLESKEIYALIVVDKREGNIAMLKGKAVIPVISSSSNVPGKTRAGGQCLVPSTLIQSSMGDIFEIDKAHNPNVVSSADFSKNESSNTPITDKWDVKKNKIYKITTKYPRLQIEASKDHIFFVNNDNVEEIAAEDLKIGDFLLMPEKINNPGIEHFFNPVKYHNNLKILASGKNLIKTTRLHKAISQKDLAKEISVSSGAISRIELGKYNPNAKTIQRLCHSLNLDFENFSINHTQSVHNVRIPQKLDRDLAQILGYFLGDGHFEKERIGFSEQREDVAKYYENLCQRYFNAKTSLNFRENKGYWQLRVNGKSLVRFFENEFPELKKASTSSIPKNILESDNSIVSSFLKGLYDAEGYVNRGSIGIGLNNKKIIQQIQMLLLRFSMISSIHEYDNNRNNYSENIRYTLDISEKRSLELFTNKIGFTSADKIIKLKSAVKSKTGKSSVRQIAKSGSEIRKLIQDSGYNLELFPKVNSFFRNERLIGKQIFKSSILDVIEKKDKNLFLKLKSIHEYPFLPVKIDSIEVIEKDTKMVDIATGKGNFIANGLIVHNSAQRFERLREGAAKEFFTRMGQHMTDQLLPLGTKLKGIIIGGPGHTKNEFVDGNFITNDLKKKIIAIKDITYTGDFGFEELLERSQDVLSEAELATEKRLLGKFFQDLSLNPNLVSYGKDQVMHALNMGAVDILLLSESLDDSVIEEFETAAANFGSNVEIVSTESREGSQLKEIGKIAALLRYEIQQ